MLQPRIAQWLGSWSHKGLHTAATVETDDPLGQGIGAARASRASLLPPPGVLNWGLLDSAEGPHRAETELGGSANPSCFDREFGDRQERGCLRAWTEEEEI
ncbi:hypothetical protein NDU88_002930 [Pleurodeles waltl]|uniref:Uncharacterized protein n=1 Tax=Pleurodeles waltl TaxID=8319 RepID=A0AAV7NHT0_PLEWA|nr:hypothetical protein NDU88_002930 [Pleurodeles waltl]